MKVVDTLRGVPVLITGAAFPLLATGARNDRPGFERLAALLFQTLLSAAVPIAVGAWMLAPAVIRTIYGPGFEPAAAALAVAGWAVIGIFLNHALINLLVTLDLQRLTIAGAAGAAVVNLVGLLVLAPRYGLPGAAAALVISETAFLLINLVLVRGRAPGFGKRIAARAVLPLLAGLGMAAFLYWVARPWHPVAAGAAGVGVYVLALAATGGLPWRRSDAEAA
jgi:O-antigen/teichoic acid export membrane protein